ncbi:MAG: hypothetical protein MJ016_01200 [Victivallaceae bacterium]|nr:hypothetical protein [Victivallaceae bacterium]
MEGSWVGCGGALPGPSTLHGAVQNAFYQRFPEEAKRNDNEKISSSLRTCGPFLQKGDDIYFPVPLDVAPGNRIMTVKKLSGASDLPVPLVYAVCAPDATKESAAPWIGGDNFVRYLKGLSFHTEKTEIFFAAESRPGIALNPSTHTTRKGAFYRAEYLRLQSDVALTGSATLRCNDELDEAFPASGVVIQLGGQQGGVYADVAPGGIVLPQAEIRGNRVKWVLLTPAAWNNGWLPDFVATGNNTFGKVPGELLLRASEANRPARLPGEKRMDYRRRIAQNRCDIKARLVAARVGKPIAYSGWEMDAGGSGRPRPTRLFVPAGSVYYFEAENEEQAKILAQSLQGRALSAFGGNAGCGIGVCGTFQINQ